MVLDCICFKMFLDILLAWDSIDDVIHPIGGVTVNGIFDYPVICNSCLFQHLSFLFVV